MAQLIGLGYFWQELKKRIEIKLVERTSILIRGGPQNYEQYRDQVAFIAALNWVMDEARDIFDDKKQQTVASEEE